MTDLKGRPAQVVACLKARGPADVTTIANRTNIPRSSVNRVCLKLADEGLLVRTGTRPITYQALGSVEAPEWVALPDSDAIEPMCKPFFEAARRAARSAPDASVILDNEHFIAAQKIWGK